jgi:hypothetical protein
VTHRAQASGARLMRRLLPMSAFLTMGGNAGKGMGD